ncbi:Histone-lysine N-methyltransferase ASHR1 [Zea mays]|uniref:Histone-lysine N-methyltransferase ASHR1 n=1 Tax=Zea mays TaxID=4577 RepID=A0A3L6EME5_MAIZE|nr:Histone-lysine N-methyltransferase ASHR1 [Zea mays]
MASWLEQLQRELAARGLTVASIPGKGRGLIATCTFFPGDVILIQEPYASTPNKILVGSSCDHCFTSGNLRKCSMCRVTWYCSSNCQKEEWKLHQLECRAMAALTEDRKKMLTPTIRLMVRLALKRKLQNEKVLSALFLPLFSLPGLKLYVVAHVVISFYSFLENGSVIPSSSIDNYNLVDGLESHISKVDENQLVLYAQMANLVSLILPFIELDLKEIAQTFSKA